MISEPSADRLRQACVRLLVPKSFWPVKSQDLAPDTVLQCPAIHLAARQLGDWVERHSSQLPRPVKDETYRSILINTAAIVSELSRNGSLALCLQPDHDPGEQRLASTADTSGDVGDEEAVSPTRAPDAFVAIEVTQGPSEASRGNDISIAAPLRTSFLQSRSRSSCEQCYRAQTPCVPAQPNSQRDTKREKKACQRCCRRKTKCVWPTTT